ncbi:serine/arginine repetitive matrix protein 1-like [Sycon ciliatum]|uniref:serine/arginine repetitive matrix protein 1-like n=1 Tax=Sycon ciliatum TaxID=27933 RepID=UPI0031F6D343
MYSIGEVRNSVFDDSEDTPPSASSPSSMPSWSSGFEMIRHQMMMESGGELGNSLNVHRTSPSSIRNGSLQTVGIADGGAVSAIADLTRSDSCMPTRLDASAFTTVLSKSSEVLLDRDQALRHSHVMETVRSLSMDTQTRRWSARSKQMAKAKVAAGRNASTLPSASTRRQTVPTSATASRRTQFATPPPPAGQQMPPHHGPMPPPPNEPPPKHTRLRRYASDPSTTHKKAVHKQSLEKRSADDLVENTSQYGRKQRTASPVPADGSLANSSKSTERPQGNPRPRNLPPLTAEDHKLVHRGGQRRRASLDTPMGMGPGSSMGDGLPTSSSPKASLKSRPPTSMPQRRPLEHRSSKSEASIHSQQPARKGSRKKSDQSKLRVRAKFIIPEIIITTCPDMEPPDVGPAPLVQSRTPTAPDVSTTYAERAAERKRKRNSNTATGSFSVSY